MTKEKLGRSVGKRVVVTKGPVNKGDVGVVVKTFSTCAELLLDSGSTALIDYRKIEFVDANDNRVSHKIMDIFGQEIEIEHLLAYSASAHHKGSHSFEVGRVESITDAGSPMVVPILRDGRKISYKPKAHRVDPARAVRLPVDDVVLVTAALTNFENLRDQSS